MCILIVPILMLLLHMLYYIEIYAKGDISVRTDVIFLKRNANFTMPGFKVCLSHVFQLNLLTADEIGFVYNMTFRPNKFPTVPIRGHWWPKLGNIVLRARSLLEGELNVTQVFRSATVERFQTCFNMQRNIKINATFPGAIHGVELILNFQTYEEIPAAKSTIFTLLNVIPIMSREFGPNIDNRIHISPGRFSSVRLQTTVHNSTERRASDVECQSINMRNYGTNFSIPASPVSYWQQLLKENLPSDQPDACIVHQHRSLVTEAKLKYTKNLVTTGLRGHDLKRIRQHLKSAMARRSKFDPSYRTPLVNRLNDFRHVNRDVERFLDLEYEVACKDVGINLARVSRKYNLPNVRADLTSLAASANRFFIQMIDAMTKGRQWLSYLVSKAVRKMNIFIAMIVHLQSLESVRENEIVEIIDPSFLTVFDIIQSTGVLSNRYYRLFENFLNSAGRVKAIFSSMEFNRILRRLLSLPGSKVSAAVRRFKLALENSEKCNKNSIKPRSMFTSRGLRYHVDRLNATHTYIRIPYDPIQRDDVNRINLKLHNGTMPTNTTVSIPSYLIGLDDEKYVRNYPKFSFDHAPYADRIELPSYVVLTCIVNTVTTSFSAYGATEYYKSFDFRNRNAKFQVMTDYSLFALNEISTDYCKHGQENDTLWDLLESDHTACARVTSSIQVSTAPTVKLGDIYRYRKDANRRRVNDRVIMNTVKLMGTARHCIEAGEQFRNDFTAFQDYYTQEILEPFESFAHNLNDFLILYSRLSDIKTPKFINITNESMSIQYQLRVLQKLIQSVIDGNDETKLAHFLDRHGIILMGVLQIQLASLKLKNNKFEKMTIDQLEVVNKIREIEKSLHGSRSERLDVFESVFYGIFRGEHNGSHLLSDASECILRKHLKIQHRYHMAERTLRQWLQQIIYLIQRSKRFVNHLHINEDFLRKNIAVVHLFYEDFNIRLEENLLVLTLKQLQAQFGSIVNMYLGAGGMHVVYFMIAAVTWFLAVLDRFRISI